MIENLNKENFWNDLHKKYPDAVDHFCKWIDEYKKEVGWDELFKVDYKTNPAGGMFKVKFHDIPFEMQYGILYRYTNEMFDDIDYPDRKMYAKIAKLKKTNITHTFRDLNRKMVRKKNKKS